jgi:hypothetical protein
MSEPSTIHAEILDTKTEEVLPGTTSALVTKTTVPISLPSEPSRRLSPKDFQTLLDEEAQKRAMLDRYIKDHLKEGIHYGPITLHRKDCETKWNPEDGCRKSKNTLFKPGAEELCRLMHLRPAFDPDGVDATAKFMRENNGTLIVKCRLLSDEARTEGEGMGARAPGDGFNENLNSRIKMALKSAHIDAALRTIGLSAYFTQDLEDMTHAVEDDASFSEPPAPRPSTGSPASRPITNKQWGMLFGIAREKGYDEDAVKGMVREKFKCTMEQVSTKLASSLIDVVRSWPMNEAKTPIDHPDPVDSGPQVPVDEPPPDEPIAEDHHAKKAEAAIREIRETTVSYSDDRLKRFGELLCKMTGTPLEEAEKPISRAEAVLKIPKGWRKTERAAPYWGAVEAKLVQWVRAKAAEADSVPF